MTNAVEKQSSLRVADAKNRTHTHSTSPSRRRNRDLRRSGRFAVSSPSEPQAPRHLACAACVPRWKRVLDVSCILLSLPVTLPLMLTLASWIKLVSRGPALFKQERIGRNGRPFTLYKFRSMRVDADTGRHHRHFRNLVRNNMPMVKLDLLCDSRLIPGGCFLRSAGLDELPQLFNVLRGEMSLVGPRPCLPEEFRFFTPAQRVRFEVLPGLTGLWQVEGKGVSTFGEMNAMDAAYVRLSSVALDLRLMVRTPFALLRQLGEVVRQRRSDDVGEGTLPASGDATLTGYSTQRLG